MRKFLYSIVLSTLFLAGNGWGATYYVNQTGGSDANNGLSTGSAWKTIAKVNASSYAAGDSILFKRGETWREQLRPPSSGSAGSPITFGAYGTGNAPIISGSDLVATWTVYSGNVYQASCSTEPQVVTFNNTMGIKETALGNLNVAYEWYWTGSTLYVYSAGGDPDTVYTSPGIAAGKRGEVIRPDNRAYITIRDIQVWGPNNTGIYSEGEDHLSIDNVVFKYVGEGTDGAIHFGTGSTNGSITNSTVQYTRSDAIWSRSTNFVATGNTINNIDGVNSDGIQTAQADAVTITGNTIDFTGQTTGIKHCIIVSAGAGPHIVSGNTLTACPDQGIMLNVSNIVVSNNLIRNVQGSGNGIGLNNEIAENNVTIQYNVIYGCKNGIKSNVTNATSNLNVYNNTVYATTGKAFSYNMPLSGNIKNNIFYVATPGAGDGKVFDLAFSSIVGGGSLAIGNNIIGPQTTHFMRDSASKNYDTLSAWVSGTGYDTNSKKDDPLFISKVTPDFRLQSGSPAINSGVDVGLSRDFVGNFVPLGSAPDIGAYEFTPLMVPQSPAFLRITP